MLACDFQESWAQVPCLSVFDILSEVPREACGTEEGQEEGQVRCSVAEQRPGVESFGLLLLRNAQKDDMSKAASGPRH